MRFDITVQDREVREFLQRLIDRGEDIRPAYRALGAALKSRVDLGFRTGRDPYGNPWAPIKHRKGQPLRDTGRLQRSSGFQALAEALYVGLGAEYAPRHQFGQGVLVRKMLPDEGLPSDWATDVLDMLQDHILGRR